MPPIRARRRPLSVQEQRFRRFFFACHHLILLLEGVGVMLPGVDQTFEAIQVSKGEWDRLVRQLEKKLDTLNYRRLFRRHQAHPDIIAMRNLLRERLDVLLDFADWMRLRALNRMAAYFTFCINHGMDPVEARMCTPYGSPLRCDGCSRCRWSVWLLPGEQFLNTHYRYKSMDEQARHREYLEYREWERLQMELDEQLEQEAQALWDAQN